MSDRYERLNRQIDALLADRRPPPAAPEDAEEQAVQRMAARLRLLRPVAAQPRPRFLRRLQRRLADAINPRPRLGRRPVLLGGAGGLLAGALGGLALAVGRRAPTPGGALDLTGWAVAGALSKVPDGGALAFATPALSGYLMRTGTKITALSGVCNHRGCRVDWVADGRQFVCACDGATFDQAGQFVEAPYEAAGTPAIPPLTPLAVRIVGDAVYVKRA